MTMKVTYNAPSVPEIATTSYSGPELVQVEYGKDTFPAVHVVNNGLHAIIAFKRGMFWLNRRADDMPKIRRMPRGSSVLLEEE